MQSHAAANTSAHAPDVLKAPRLIRLREVQHRTGFSRSQIYRLVAKGELPRPIKVSEATSAWIESEVDTWIKDRIAAHRKEGV